MFGKRKKQENEICVRLGEHEVYRGTLTDLPLKEEIILEKSEEFFNDPNPCFIHRSAVRVRLLAELEEAAGRREWELWENIWEWQLTVWTSGKTRERLTARTCAG